MAHTTKRENWVPDEGVTECFETKIPFSLTERKHHCRICGKIFIDDVSFWRTLCEKQSGSSEPKRMCFKCLMKLAKEATNLDPQKAPPDLSPAIKVGTGKSESFENLKIIAEPAVSGDANTKITLKNCFIEGKIERESNGILEMFNCYVTGVYPLKIGGNNHVKLHNCLIIGDVTAVELYGNAKLEANDTWFIGVGEPKGIRSTGIKMSGSSKAELTKCVVTATYGVSGYGGSKFTGVGGSVCGQAAFSSFLDSTWAIAGKHELNHCKTIGRLLPHPVETSNSSSEHVSLKVSKRQITSLKNSENSND